MDTAVVAAVAAALAAAGRRVLRFNFGGVGRSGGAYTGGPGEVDDVRTALAALAARLPSGAPRALVGYSFGAWVAAQAAAAADVERLVAIAPPIDLLDFGCLIAVGCPVVCLAGDRDQYCAAAALGAVAARSGGRVVARTLAGADHFLAGREAEVAALAVAALA
jgi:alpha/beta superfamily hydrolase